MQRDPLVTIGIPTLNRPEMLVRAVQSVLAQDYKNLEVVVCDNASNPPSRSALEPLLEDSRLRYVYFEEQVDMVPNWNRCLALAKGDLWLCLSDDDWLDPDAVRTLVERFMDESIGMVTCSRYMVTGELYECREVPGNGTVRGQQFINDRLTGCDVGCPAAEMFKTELVRKVGGYQDIGMTMDLLLELDVSAISDVAYVKKPLVYYALHAGNASVYQSEAYVDSHLALSEHFRERHIEWIADEVRQYCIRAIFNRMRACAVGKTGTVCLTGYRALCDLMAPCQVKAVSGLFSISAVRFLLRGLRAFKHLCK